MALGTGPSLRNLRRTRAAQTTDDGRTGGGLPPPRTPPDSGFADTYASTYVRVTSAKHPTTAKKKKQFGEQNFLDEIFQEMFPLFTILAGFWTILQRFFIGS